VALVGNISGSIQNSSNIGVSGSVVIANRPDALFPTLNSVGGDVVFFVSGSRGGKGVTSERTVSVFGGDAVVSGSLTIGTGSITITSNDITFQGGIAQIFSGSGGLTFADSSGTKTLSEIASGGGDVTGPTSSTDNAIARFDLTTGKIIQNSDLTVSDLAGGAGGTVNLDTNSAATVNLFTTNATSVVIGKSGGSTVTTNGNIKVGSNIIQAADGATALTLTSTSGNVAVAGELTVTGNNIKSSTGATAIALSGDSVTIPGDLTVNGTTTTVNTTNLIIEDPLIYMASSSAPGTVGYGGIAIASGSGVTNQALVFVKDTNGTEAVWSSGRQDVKAGSETTNTSLTYLPIRASKFEVGGTIGGAGRSFISSSDGFVLSAVAGGDLFLNAAAGPPGSNGNITFEVAGTDYLQVSGSGGNTVEIKAPALILTASILDTTTEVVRAFSSSTSIRLGASAGTTTTIRGGTLVGNQAIQNIFNDTATTVNFAGAATTLNVGGATGNSTANIAVSDPGVGNTKTINIGTSGGANSTTNINLGSSAGGTITANRSLIPSVDVTYNLGGANNRWANIYTGDLHLKNERGDYTLIEEEDFLSIRFNKTGKRYKFVLEPVPELDEK
jgi:hypothetical protein